MIELSGQGCPRAGSLISGAGLFLFLLLVWSGHVAGAGTQTAPDLTLRQNLQSIRQAFHDELDSLARTCLEQQMPAEAARARRNIIQRDPQRQYIFLPPATTPAPPEDATGLQKSFFRRLNEIRKTHAARLFEQVQYAADQALGSEAYQLLHEVLVYDPQHAAARKILGFREDRQPGWVRQKQRPVTARLSKQKQSVIGWEKETYWKVVSPHFEIFAAGGADDGRALAEELERTYWIWRQVFFEYWCSTKRLQEWLKGTGSDSIHSRQYEVILFRDRDHYLADLADVPGVHLSSGYYNERQKASFFYSGDVPPVSSWRHETIHQLLQENARTGPRKSVAGKGHAWLVEGVAMYFESMQVHDDHVTLGGFDAWRLQYARLRCQREGFYVPMAELDAMDRAELQQHAEVGKLYSQAAGISQFLFTAGQGQYRPGFIDFIREFYQERRVKSSLAEKTLALDQLDRQYAEFLNVDRTRFQKYFFNRETTGLALGRSGLKNEDLALLAGCTGLEWLELSENPLADAGLEQLSELTGLTRLFLDVTGITDTSAKTLGQLVGLQELDLASTRVGDATIDQLAGLPDLQVLWLAGSRVTDGCIESLAAMPRLQLLDLRQTAISDQGIAQLKRARPDLEIMR